MCFANPGLEAPAWEEITEALTDPEVGLCAHSARFTHADVVEHICALSGGRLDLRRRSPPWPTGSSPRIWPCASPPTTRSAGARPPQWSTAAHRATEDRTLALADTLAARTVPTVSAAAVIEALRREPGLGRRSGGGDHDADR